MERKPFILFFLGLALISSAFLPLVSAAITVTTDDTSYYTGKTVAISASGFSPVVRVMIQVNDPDGDASYVSERVSTSAGTISHSFKIPSDWKEGQYTVIVGVSGQTKTATFLVEIYTPPTPPTPPSPPPSAEDIGGMSAEDAAVIFEGLSVSDAVTLIEELDTETVADILELVEAEAAANIIKEVDVAAAADILELVDVAAAVDIIDEVAVDSAANILELMETEVAADIIEEVALEHAADIMNEMEEEASGAILIEVDTTPGAQIIEAMAEDNITRCAQRVESAIKIGARETDPATAQEKIKKVADKLELVPVDTLVDILIEMAGLPATPSTVARVFEVMNLGKVLDVVAAWIDTGFFEELAKVYGYLTSEALSNMYLGMSAAQRSVLYPYFDAETSAALPVITEFQVSGLTISPETVEPGEAVSISVVVKNVGDEIGSHMVTLKIKGVTEDTELVTLSPGISTTVAFTVTKTILGSYTVVVDGETGSFTVKAPPTPAEFQTSNLAVSPSEVRPGGEVTVSVTVSNVGEESGSYTVEVKVDGVVVDSKTVTLDGGVSTSVSFTVSSSVKGSHTVTIDTLSGSFTVKAPFPWGYVIIVVLVAAVGAGYFLYKRNPELFSFLNR